jgi:hypothetical protein
MTGWHQITGLPVENQFFAMRHGRKKSSPVEKALDCALRKKAALFGDANCAVVPEVVRWATCPNHPRMVRYCRYGAMAYEL